MERDELKRKRKTRGSYFSYLSSPTKLIPERTLFRQSQNNHKRLLYDADKVGDAINVDDEVVDVIDVQCEVDKAYTCLFPSNFKLN